MEKNNNNLVVDVWIVATNKSSAYIYKKKAVSQIDTSCLGKDDISTKYTIMDKSDLGPESFYICNGKTSCIKVLSIVSRTNISQDTKYYSLDEKDAKSHLENELAKIKKSNEELKACLITKKEAIKSAITNNKKAFIIHFRFTPYKNERFTVVGIKKKHSIKIGLSFCNPKDNFCKKIGVEQAYSRAIENPIIFPCSKEATPREIRDMLNNFAEMCRNSKMFLARYLYENK
jgi:hypothetical protein